MQFGVNNDTSLFLECLIGNIDNELTIICSKSIERPSTTEENKASAQGNDTLLKILDGTTVVEPNPKQVYKIYFDEYIMYQARAERFCMFDPDEVRIGNGLILFEKSKLLDHLRTFTPFLLGTEDGHPGYPGGDWKHYGIYTEFNVIDVISHREPIIERVKLEDYNFAV